MKISRPYIRLDRQPEVTRRLYADEDGIPLHELIPDPERDAVVRTAKSAQDVRSNEIDTVDVVESRNAI